MPLAAPPDATLCRPAITDFSGYSGVQYKSGRPVDFDVTRRQLDVLRFGQTVYHLLKPAEGIFYPATACRGWEFLAEIFGDRILGHGRTPNHAYEDWLKCFHGEFQRLYAMRPFEMDGADAELWDMIRSQVDVERYRASQHVVLRQQGKVYRARPYPEIVEWEDGTRERIALPRMPAEFATYRSGQPFEALVHRDPASYKMLKVEYVKRLPAGKTLTEEESKRLWDSVPTSDSLPDTDWN